MPQQNSVLITGAGRGFGNGLQRVFFENGWLTFPLVRNQSHADALSEKYSKACFPIIADISSDECIEVIETVLDEHSVPIDILINNAGMSGRVTQLKDVDSEEMLNLFQVHCLGALRVTRAAMPWLLRANNPYILNISSRLGSMRKNVLNEFSNRPSSYSYRIAKAAQNMLSLCLAQEFGSKGITVLAVHPGSIKTRAGYADAQFTEIEAAERLYHWLLSQPADGNCRFVEPEEEELLW
jgi:NAD(P)-dependent dehydrogenase (short-subunit alcohol dehydrogenase family)